MKNRKTSKEQLRLMAAELQAYENGLKKDYSVNDFIDREKVKVDKATREKIFELKAKDLDIPSISGELGLLNIEVEVVLENDAKKIKTSQRWVDSLRLYRDGETLETIGKKLGITRERARQICKKQIAVELGYGPGEARHRQTEIDTIYKSIVSFSSEDRVRDNVLDKYEVAKSKGIEPQYFNSLANFSKVTGIQTEHLKKYLPEAYGIVHKNSLVAKRRWSRYYEACRMCDTTEIKHRGYGYCENCYLKSPEWKATVKLSYQRNKEARKAAFQEYSADYYNRPEIKEKLEREYDEKYFGGNRKMALERDGYKCLNCGQPTNVKDAAGRPKVRVWHLNGNNTDNSLSNLGTYCQSCLYRLKLGNTGHNFGRRKQ